MTPVTAPPAAVPKSLGMGLLSRRSPYDRTRILAAATRAHSRRRRRKAIALYRQVLAVEPGNGELHGRIAPLLAETRQRFDAWQSFRAAARAQLRDRNVEGAVATYREAVRCLPHELDAWLALARLQRKEAHPARAAETLLRAVPRFRGRRRRPQAIHLLRHIREIHPWEPDVVIDLARRLARSRQAHEAKLQLSGLATRVEGRDLVRVRAAQWRLEPSLASTWHWLRAACAARRGRAAAQSPAAPSASAQRAALTR